MKKKMLIWQVLTGLALCASLLAPSFVYAQVTTTGADANADLSTEEVALVITRINFAKS
jgi:hypothetical protein